MDLTVQISGTTDTATVTDTPAQSVEKTNGIVLPIAFDAVEMDYEGVG